MAIEDYFGDHDLRIKHTPLGQEPQFIRLRLTLNRCPHPSKKNEGVMEYSLRAHAGSPNTLDHDGKAFYIASPLDRSGFIRLEGVPENHPSPRFTAHFSLSMEAKLDGGVGDDESATSPSSGPG